MLKKTYCKFHPNSEAKLFCEDDNVYLCGDLDEYV